MQGINAVKEGHSRAKGRRIGSVEEEALETFAALKKAQQMEHELRNFVTGHYGMDAWQQIIRIQAVKQNASPAISPLGLWYGAGRGAGPSGRWEIYCVRSSILGVSQAVCWSCLK